MSRLARHKFRPMSVDSQHNSQLQTAGCDLTTPDSADINFFADTSKWMPPYIASWLTAEHNSLIPCFFDSRVSKKQILIIFHSFFYIFLHIFNSFLQNRKTFFTSKPYNICKTQLHTPFGKLGCPEETDGKGEER